MLVGVGGNDAEVQRRGARAGVPLHRRSDSLRRSLAPTVLQVAASPAIARCTTGTSRSCRHRQRSPRSTTGSSTRCVVPRIPRCAARRSTFAVSPAVRTQDTGHADRAAAGLPWSRDAAWAFIKDQWPALIEKLGAFQGIPGIVAVAGHPLLARRARADVKRVLREEPASAPSNARCSRQSSASRAAPRSTRGSRRPLAELAWRRRARTRLVHARSMLRLYCGKLSRAACPDSPRLRAPA